jgi:hypothetical protein
MVRLYASEKFKEIPIDAPLRKRYAVSNYGRLMSFTETFEDGIILKGGKADGYRIMRYKIRVDKKEINKHIFLYKLVAEYFIPKTSEDQKHVLHLDRARDNDNHKNLKWATREEWLEHSRNSPHVIAARKKLVEHNIKSDGAKLTVTQVMLLKKRLLDPNRKTRIKILAKQYGVSEMQLQRIKTGENWGHIKVD